MSGFAKGADVSWLTEMEKAGTKFYTSAGRETEDVYKRQGKGNVYVPAEAMQYYTTAGRDYEYGPQNNENHLLTTYLNYNKYIDSWKSSIDATVGLSLIHI